MMPADVDAHTPARPRTSRLSVDRRMGRVALALGLAPLVVAAVALVVGAGDILPAHDIAQLEMRTRDVGEHQVLLGPYSRDGWFHLGPALFYLLAIPYRLTGGSSVGLYLGALAVNAASIAGMALIARRRAGLPLMLITLLASTVLVGGLGPELVRDPWNPYITVLPYGLLIFLAWAMACGERWALPVGAAVATFLAQTHIGYVVLALPLLAWGAVWLGATEFARRRSARAQMADTAVADTADPDTAAPDDVGDNRRGDAVGRSGAGLARTIAVTAGVLALLWLPPVIEQATGDSGNLGKALFYFRTNDEPGQSLSGTMRIVSEQFALPPAWVTGLRSISLQGEPVALYDSFPLPVLLAPVMVAVVFLWRQGSRDARRFLLTAAAATAFGVVAIHRTTGVAFTYRLHWTSVLGMLTGIVVAWSGWLALRPHVDSAGVRRLTAGVTSALVAAAAVMSVQALQAAPPEQDYADPLAVVVPDAVAYLDDAGQPGRGVVSVESSSFESMLLAPGVALALEKAGVPARLPPLSEAPGEHRVLEEGDDVAVRLTVVVNGDVTDARLRDDLVEVASWGDVPVPRPPDDPAVLREQAFLSGDIEAQRRLGEAYMDDPEIVMFPIDAVALFAEAGP
jgi:hypothetical protein